MEQDGAHIDKSSEHWSETILQIFLMNIEVEHWEQEWYVAKKMKKNSLASDELLSISLCNKLKLSGF